MTAKYEKKIVKVFISEEEMHSEFTRLFREGLTGEEKGHYTLMLLNDFLKVFTPERLNLLKAIASVRPSSVRELARMVGRDVKNVHGDLQLLYSHGLIELEENGSRKVPVVPYRKLRIEFAGELEIEVSEKKIA